MPRSDYYECEGRVLVGVLPSMRVMVNLDNGLTIPCTISDKLRMNYTRILNGDRVTVRIPTIDSSKGEIVCRKK